MNTRQITALIVASSLCIPSAFAAGGESWEVTSKTEMPGMPAGMGDQTTTVCIPKGAEKDPAQLMRQDGDCTMTGMKTSGNKITWQMRCSNNGEEMSGTGEITFKPNSYQGIARLSGKADGQTINVTASYSGKRLGAACDTAAGAVAAPQGMENVNDMMGMYKAQMAGAMAEQCEISNFQATELISSRFFGPAATCAGKEKFACKVIAKEVLKDADVFAKLAKHDDTSDVSIAQICKIDMAAATKATCAKVDGGNYQDLADYCPAEAGAFASGRSYTSGVRSQGAVPENPAATPAANPVGNALDNAQKLKSLFGF